MAIRLFYPIGKCDEQIIATSEESRLFAHLLLKDMKLLLEENENAFLNEKEMNDKSGEDYFHYVKTIPDFSGIIKKIGYRLGKKDSNFTINICEYRFIGHRVVCKLMGRLNYDVTKKEVSISSIRYYSTNKTGMSTARYSRVQDYSNERLYFGT